MFLSFQWNLCFGWVSSKVSELFTFYVFLTKLSSLMNRSLDDSLLTILVCFSFQFINLGPFTYPFTLIWLWRKMALLEVMFRLKEFFFPFNSGLMILMSAPFFVLNWNWDPFLQVRFSLLGLVMRHYSSSSSSSFYLIYISIALCKSIDRFYVLLLFLLDWLNLTLLCLSRFLEVSDARGIFSLSRFNFQLGNKCIFVFFLSFSWFLTESLCQLKTF